MTTPAGAHDLIGIGEAAGLLGVSEQTVRRWADRGGIPHVRTPGGQRRFSRATVEALLTIAPATTGA